MIRLLKDGLIDSAVFLRPSVRLCRAGHHDDQLDIRMLLPESDYLESSQRIKPKSSAAEKNTVTFIAGLLNCVSDLSADK